MVTVVPTPRTDSTVISSLYFFMLGRPMPAPKPRFRTESAAVVQPACMACSMSGMPGPRSVRVMVMSSSPTSTRAVPPLAWMTMLISPSYIQTDTRRMTAGSSPSLRRDCFTAEDASPARLRSPPSTWYVMVMQSSMALSPSVR